MGVSVMNPVGGGVLAVTTPAVMRLLRGARSAAEVGLRYVLATPGVTCALSGMNEMAQLRENLAVAGRKTPMTPLQRERMQERLGKLETAAREFCTACGYCMPCKHGVDIPGNFDLLNRARLYGQEEWAGDMYGRLKQHPDGDRSAAACKQCGDCEPKCPNNVPIIKQLQEVVQALG
jgi:predicted aldo/keto reductase-like oxidoreductase